MRERLLQAADDLFYRGASTRSVSTAFLEHAGVAKASLYSTFGSKEELLRAYLEDRAQRLKDRFEGYAARAEDPRGKLLAIFDGLVERAKEPDYRGCAFIRACAEAPPAPNAARDVTATYRAWRHSLFARLAKEAGARDAEATAMQLAIIYDGTACSVSMDSNPRAAVMARKAVEHLLDEHLEASKSPSTGRRTRKN